MAKFLVSVNLWSKLFFRPLLNHFVTFFISLTALTLVLSTERYLAKEFSGTSMMSLHEEGMLDFSRLKLSMVLWINCHSLFAL